MVSAVTRLYCRLVFGKPWLAIALLALLLAGAGWYAQYFKLDVSADSLMMEGDEDLEYSRTISERYGMRESVLVAYTPEGELFSRPVLARLAELRQDLLAVETVESVDSLLNAPLFGDTPLTAISEDYDTVMDPEVDLEAAREELTQSPVFRNAIISADGGTAALLVNFENDERYLSLLQRRSELRERRDEEGLSAGEQRELDQVSEEFDAHSTVSAERRHENIAQIRQILGNYQNSAQVYLGGAPMIADDLVTFVASDLTNFSIGVFAFIVIALGLIFRRLRWVLIPLAACGVAGVVVVGILGLMDWRVTVVSSNFISLLLIITISFTVHLIVRYRQLRGTRRFSSSQRILQHSVLSMFKPCFYTALTTIVAFGSLVVSGISPIISFGWMMVMGVATSLLVVFILFPAVMTLLKKEPRGEEGAGALRMNLTSALARLTDRAGNGTIFVYAGIFVLACIGLLRLEVENSFIEYFSEDTEIYQGMKLFDEKLGGTLSFDVVVNFDGPASGSGGETQDAGGASGGGESAPPAAEDADEFGDSFDDFGGGFDDFGDESFDDFGGGFDEAEDEAGQVPGSPGNDENAYWFTAERMNRVEEIHDFLDAHPQTGKVLSFGSVIKLAEELNGNDPIDSFLWAVLYSRIPDTLKESVLTPFISVAENEARFNVRVIESDEELKRNQLLNEIRQGLQEQFGYGEEQVRLTGILVLYNNVLQSLYESQILTLGVVLLAIMLMFLILFRSLKIAVLCIIPNIFAAAFVLGVMGWLSIPLDIMTITIAAISIGIGVDNTIHYMHRFRREFTHMGNYQETMYFCHDTIARAMYFTSMVIVAGFSILVLSNFVPTMVFGLLTSIAMLVALLGSLTLLPRLLILFQPLGSETVPGSGSHEERGGPA